MNELTHYSRNLFQEFCIEHDTERNGLDDLNLISFGLRYEIIRRVHSVPVNVNATKSLVKTDSFDTQVSAVKRLIDGSRTFDEICGETTMSAAEVSMVCDSLGEDIVVVRM